MAPVTRDYTWINQYSFIFSIPSFPPVSSSRTAKGSLPSWDLFLLAKLSLAARELTSVEGLLAISVIGPKVNGISRLSADSDSFRYFSGAFRVQLPH
jgi:hypothetical protein